MGFNRRKMEDQRRQVAEKDAAARRATDAQMLEDAERLIAAWNEREAKRMPMLFSPAIGAAITAGYWFLWVRCPACRTINAIDLRALDRHPDAGGNEPHSRIVLPLVPAECAIRGARAPIVNEHCRRNAHRAHAAGAWRIKSTGQPLAARVFLICSVLLCAFCAGARVHIIKWSRRGGKDPC